MMSMPSEQKVMCSFAWHGWGIAAQSQFGVLESHISHVITTLKFVLERYVKICLLLSLECKFKKFYSKNSCRFTENYKRMESLYLPHLLSTHMRACLTTDLHSLKTRTIPCTSSSLWFLSCVQIQASAIFPSWQRQLLHCHFCLLTFTTFICYLETVL